MMARLDIGDNLGCFLIVLAIYATFILAGAKCTKAIDSVECVKAGGQWHEPNGCGRGHCEKVTK